MSDEARTGRFGQRTRIAYDAYSETSPKLKLQKRNTTVALRVVFSNITRGVFCHSCFCKGVWRCLRIDVGDLNTPLLFYRAGVVVVKRLCGRKKESKR